MSTTLYVEEFPTYKNVDEKVHVLSVYFYFHGNEQIDVLPLYEKIRESTNAKYSQIKNLILSECQKTHDPKSFAYTEKEVSCFLVKPPKNFKIFIRGNDFCGYSLWSSFFFLSKNRDFCLCDNQDDAKLLFNSMIKNPDLFQNRSYLSSINYLKLKGIKFHGG